MRDGLRVLASFEHRWPLSDGRLVTTADLRLGDVIMRSTLPAGEGNADLDFAWMAGLYVAEGTMDRAERNVRFSLHAQEEGIAERLERIAERLGAHYHTTVKGNKREVFLFGQAPVGILKHFVEGRLSYGKHFTHYLFRQNPKVIKAALMGYLIGDGSLTERDGRQAFWTLGFTGQNGQLVEDLRAMCAILGYRCRLDHGSAMETKTRKRFATYTGWIKMTEPKWNEGDLGEIIDIENAEEMTYEIEVDGDHLFCLANGLVTHNSAQCDAVLRTGSLSDYFTQDLEDRPEQAERIVRQQKKRIVALLQQLGTGAGDKAAYEAAVQHYTGLALVPASYQEIIHRLEVCVTENLLNREPCADEMSG